MGDGQMTVTPVQFFDSIVDFVAIITQNDASIALFGDIFIDVLEVVSVKKAHSSIAPTAESPD